ncbi:hypothetical protein Bbelb_337620 [Branchiostoma belcheri]|nr:hypothetical protein Bbelb_337620 [Branchiostoma belcheri]
MASKKTRARAVQGNGISLAVCEDFPVRNQERGIYWAFCSPRCGPAFTPTRASRTLLYGNVRLSSRGGVGILTAHRLDAMRYQWPRQGRETYRGHRPARARSRQACHDTLQTRLTNSSTGP